MSQLSKSQHPDAPCPLADALEDWIELPRALPRETVERERCASLESAAAARLDSLKRQRAAAALALIFRQYPSLNWARVEISSQGGARTLEIGAGPRSQEEREAMESAISDWAFEHRPPNGALRRENPRPEAPHSGSPTPSSEEDFEALQESLIRQILSPEQLALWEAAELSRALAFELLAASAPDHPARDELAERARMAETDPADWDREAGALRLRLERLEDLAAARDLTAILNAHPTVSCLAFSSGGSVFSVTTPSAVATNLRSDLFPWDSAPIPKPGPEIDPNDPAIDLAHDDLRQWADALSAGAFARFEKRVFRRPEEGPLFDSLCLQAMGELNHARWVADCLSIACEPSAPSSRPPRSL